MSVDDKGAPLPNPAGYRECRENVTRLVNAHLDHLDVTVPACPDWTVRMLVTHLTEVCRRALLRVKGQEPAVEPPPDEIGELLVYWAKRTEELERIAASDASAISDMLIADALIHELDLRQALGAAPPDDHPVYPTAIAFGAWGMGMSLDAHGLPALRIECLGRSWTAGGGVPDAVVGGHPYDIVRSCAGRRTREQIARLSWSQAPDRWLPAFAWGPFAPPERPVEDLFADR